MPTPEEVRDIDVKWYNDIMTVLDYLDWVREDGNDLLRVINRYG